MRAFVLLLIVAVAFLLVLRFYPTGDVEGAETAAGVAARVEEDGPSVPTRFLTRPEPAEAPPVAPPRAEPGPVVDEAPADDGGLPDWLGDVESIPVRAGNELALARAILHGTPADVERELAVASEDLSEDRRRLVSSFKLAISGEQQRALDDAQQIGECAGCTPRDRELLRAALRRSAPEPRPASAREEGLLEVAMEMALHQDAATAAMARRDYEEAADAYSQLLVFELEAPWEPEQDALARWAASLNEAQRHHRWNPQGNWPGVEVEVQPGDNLTLIRERFVQEAAGRRMCTGLIEQSNQLSQYIHPGQTLRIPTDPVSVLVCLDARWLLYFLGDEVAGAWRVGVGRPGEETLTGRFEVGEKQENPAWFPQGKEMVPFGHPDNPLGTRWIAWFDGGDKTSFGFHGTNDPSSIGKAASDGCIRMRNEDVEVLHRILPMHAPIVVRQ